MKSRRVLAIHGAVYGQNFGDVVIIQLLSEELRRRLPAYELFLPFASQSFLTHSSLKVAEPPAVRDTVISVFGPGGYFGERPHSLLRWHYRLNTYHRQFLKFSRHFDATVGMFGVGVGPLSFGISRAFLKHVALSSEAIYVRDDESRDYLVDYARSPIDVHVVPDIAFLLYSRRGTMPVFGEKSGDFQNEQVPTIGLHIQGNPKRAGAGFRRFLLDLRKVIKRHPDYRFLLITDSPGGHLEAEILGLSDDFPNVSRSQYSTPSNLLELLSSLTMVITTKLHVGICAMALGTPAFAVSMHSKIPRLYNQLDIADRCVPMSEYSPGWLSDSVELVRHDRSVPDERIAEAARRVHEGLNMFADTLVGKIR